MIYQTVSDSYILSTIDKSVTSLVYTPCYNLSCIIGDKDGMLDSGIVQNVLNNLSLATSGIVVAGAFINASTYIPEVEENYSLPIDEYQPKVSQASYNLFLLLSSSDTSVTQSTGYDCVMFDYVGYLSSEEYIVLASLYLEACSLYLGLLAVTSKTNLSNVSTTDLDRLENNIRWLDNQLSVKTTIPYDLIKILRDLQKVVSYVKNLSSLFQATYVIQVEEFQLAIEGVE